MLPESTQRISLNTGPNLEASETLPVPGSPGPRVGTTPVDLAREHPVPDVNRPLHVVPDSDGWTLRFEGDGTVAGVFRLKSEAMRAARDLAAERGLRIVEHGVNGQIRS